LVRGVLGIVFGVAENCQRATELGDVDLLCVGTGLDEDDLFAGSGVREGCDGLGDCCELLSFAYCESTWGSFRATCC